MIKLLIKIFIKNSAHVKNKKVREHYSVLCGVLGIMCNMFLFSIKLSIGFTMNSIAIISDAFNNLSDTGSSVISVISSKLSNRKPDKEHPFGHGRFEYVSSLIVAFIIIFVGVELLKSSFSKITNPEPIQFNLILIIVLSLSLLIKIWMFFYNKYVGKLINSSLLKAASKDSISDVVSTSAIIISTILGQFTSLPVDGIIGLIVSLMIIFTGYKVASSTVSLLLGGSPSKELVEKIEKMIMESDGIIGIHDLMVHDYGPGRIIASVHAEVPADIDIIRIHEKIDETELKILELLGINIVIHMDPIIINSERINEIKNELMTIINNINSELTIHDFRITDGENRINLIFDLVVPIETTITKRNEFATEITKKLTEIDKRYRAVIQIDNKY